MLSDNVNLVPKSDGKYFYLVRTECVWKEGFLFKIHMPNTPQQVRKSLLREHVRLVVIHFPKYSILGSVLIYNCVEGGKKDY